MTAWLLGVLSIGPVVLAAEDQTAGAPAGSTATAASDKEVVIRGESRLKVKTEKPEPDLAFDVDEIAIPYVKTEDYVLDVSPSSVANPSLTVVNYLSSSQTASPYLQLFKRPPIMTLRPKYKAQGRIASWRLRITDGMGNVFKDFSGKNSLPEEIIWDGHGTSMEMLDVGTSYSYIFSVLDEASNPTSQMGRPMVLESLLYDAGGVTVAKVIADVLLGKQANRTLLSPKGELYCREVADILKAHQRYPLLIESYAKDVDKANSNGEIVQDFLTQLLVLPKENFKVVGYKSRLEKVVFKIQ
jgi:hypothetical protein